MTLGLNREGTKQKYTCQKWYWKVGVKYEFIDLTFPPALSVNCDNRKAMGKEIWHRTKIEKSTKNDNIELRKKKMTKWKSNFKSIKN